MSHRFTNQKCILPFDEIGQYEFLDNSYLKVSFEHEVKELSKQGIGVRKTI